MKEIQNPYAHLEGYNCFGCSPGNQFGLQLKFFEEGDEVVSFWNPEPRFQGWKNVLHGGIQATMMDEIASWVVFVKLGSVGVTYRLNTRFKKPVYIDRGDVTLRAKVTGSKRNIVTIEVSLFDDNGQLCSESIVEYFVFSEEKARKEMFYPGKEAFLSVDELKTANQKQNLKR